jgi:nucleoside-diphosphate-sugar epimerase
LGLRLQVLRIFQVFGEGEAATRFWPSLRQAARDGKNFPMSAGLQVRDFVPVEKVAQTFLGALDFSTVDPARPLIRNVGTGRGMSLLEFAKHWWMVWGAKGQLQPGEVGLRPGELPRLVANVHDVHIA